MSRVACVFAVVLFGQVAVASDLPPGALVRLGDDRFRAGGCVTQLALSPDGKQFATACAGARDRTTVAVWDAATGRPLREYTVNTELFRGLVWGKAGAFAIVRRAESGEVGKPAKVFADDFRVWSLTDPDDAPVVRAVFERATHDVVPQYDAEYADFQFSADGSRVAALWMGAGRKHAVHVFALKPADTAAKLARVGTIDLGAEGAGAVRISADGKTLVTFRAMADSDSPPGPEFVATVWDVAAGTPAKPVRVASAAGAPPRLSRGERERITHRLMLTPDGRAVVLHAAEEKGWGFDRIDIGTPHEKRELIRLPYTPAGARDRGAYAFTPSGEVLAVAVDRQTLVIDALTGKELGRLEGHASAPTAVAVSADGTTIATADAYGLVRLWDAKTFRPLRAAPGHRAPVEHAELSPEGKRLLTWASDETVRLWDVTTGKELRAFAGASARPAFTTNGTAIVFRTKDRFVARDLLTGLEVPGDVKAPRTESSLHARTTDNRTSARHDHGAVQLIEAATGEVRGTVGGHRGRVCMLGFTPDGSKLVTAGEDHTVLVWDVRLESVPLPDAFKKETSAAKLWQMLATGKADVAYLAMARLAREPGAAVKLARMKLKPTAKAGTETATDLADARAIELLESLATEDARGLLKELANGDPFAFRTQEAKRALERCAATRYTSKDK